MADNINSHVMMYMKLKERLQKIRAEKKEIASITKSIYGRQIQIDSHTKKINSINERQKLEMSKIGEEYQLDSNQVEKLIKETDNRIYNSIAAIVQARWAYSIEEYNKKVKNLFTFINIKKSLKKNQTNYKLTMS